MSPTGAADPLYILARRVLLDALEALGTQRDAVILAGAQAIYLHTGPAGLAVPEYTTDADIALNPEMLANSPLLEQILKDAGFRLEGDKVGTWVTTRSHQNSKVDVMLDILVPAAVGGPGRRGARLGLHGSRAARKVKGLEAALVDNGSMKISSLEVADTRSYEVHVAGPSALLVSKLHKISEREGAPGRLQDKDALDVLRLLRSADAEALAGVFKKLIGDKVAGDVSREAVGLLERLFGTPNSSGSMMAARAAEPLEVTETTAASCAALAGDLLKLLRGSA
jgi:ribosomal protein L11